jgi:hypothetical protein
LVNIATFNIATIVERLSEFGDFHHRGWNEKDGRGRGFEEHRVSD